MVATGDGESGFDSGEGARETATTSKEGSRRANYPIPTRGGSDNKYRCGSPTGIRNRNEKDSNPLSRNNWRASLVPAAAVIPAPIAYIKVVAVKTFVVEFVSHTGNWPTYGFLLLAGLLALVCGRFTGEGNGVVSAAIRPLFIS